MSKKRDQQPSLFETAAPPGAYAPRPLPKRTEPRRACFWPDCPEMVPASMLGCSVHWFRLPEHFRKRIWRHYRAGQETDGKPSAEYQAALEAVLRWVAETVAAEGEK